MKRTVVITEELERVIEIDVPDTLSEEEANAVALKQIQTQYREEEIVLDADDWHRTFWYVGKDLEDATDNAEDEWSRIIWQN